jgi:hypothetical protein
MGMQHVGRKELWRKSPFFGFECTDLSEPKLLKYDPRGVTSENSLLAYD